MVLKSLRKAKNEYCTVIDGMIQAIVTSKKYKEKRMNNPMREWVSLSDEAFLLLCLDNYAHVWRYEVRKREGRVEEGEREPAALYTGKGKGTKKSWHDRAMIIFNKTMKRVWTDRHERGEHFDEFLLRYMDFVYPPKSKGDRCDGEKAAAKRPEATTPVILSDFNIETVMAQEYEERNKGKKKGSTGREEIMVGNLNDDDDNANDDDDDEIEYSDNDDEEENNDEMSSGSRHEV